MVKKIPNIHPGEILLNDFLEPMNITPYRLAKETHIDQMRISEIINRKRGISVDTALRLSRFFGTTPEFWINLQTHYELEDKKDKLLSKLDRIKSYKEFIKEKVAS